MRLIQLVVIVMFLGLVSYGVYAQDVKVYEVNKVIDTPPTIDGEYSEEEWEGSEWTSDFYGLNHSANSASYQGQSTDLEWRWRALWDDDYLYVLFNANLRYINPNGWVWAEGSGDLVTPLVEDDVGYAGWGIAENLDFEFFLTPNWVEEEVDYLNEAENNPPAYQLCYFPLLPDIEGDVIYADGNYGVREGEGPPFIFSGNIGSDSMPGDWDPIFDPDAAEEAGVKPFQLAALPHLVEDAEEGVEIVGSPVLEMAIPFSQLGISSLPDVETIEDLDAGLQFMIMEPDEDGVYVHPEDIWLFNVAGYTDGPTAGEGLALVTWNEMGEGGFHNAPRGELVFKVSTSIENWMVH